MTALKPIENMTRVRGVRSDRYLPNLICAHPECFEQAEGIHHIFGRPPGPDSGSWFVTLALEDDDGTMVWSTPLPAATNLCGSGTTKHHGDLEEHRAWIKYEDGQFVWYERAAPGASDRPDLTEPWIRIGPLNPQPGAREAKPKRRPPQSGPKKQKVFSVKLPVNEDKLDVLVPRRFDELRDLLEDPSRPRSKGYTLLTALDLALIQAKD